MINLEPIDISYADETDSLVNSLRAGISLVDGSAVGMSFIDSWWCTQYARSEIDYHMRSASDYDSNDTETTHVNL